MKKQKTYLRLTLVLSVLFGIILPLVLGVKDLFTIAIIFTSIWWIYAVALFVYVFLIEGREKRFKLNLVLVKLFGNKT